MDSAGGIVKAIGEGAIQAQVARQAYEYEKGVFDSTIKKVGVNIFREEEADDDHDVSYHPVNEEDTARQLVKLAEVRAARDAARVESCLAALKEAAAGGDNVMPATVEAVKAMATVGEITRVLKSVYGTYQEPLAF